MGPEEFQKFMHGRGVHREQEMSRLEDHVRQSFKVGKEKNAITTIEIICMHLLTYRSMKIDVFD